MNNVAMVMAISFIWLDSPNPKFGSLEPDG